MSAARNTLLRVGAPEWDAINRDKSRRRLASAHARTIEELVAAGSALSAMAHEIIDTIGSSGSGDAGSS